MGNPARFRILSVTSLAAWFGLTALYPAHASTSCAEKEAQARERFRAAALPDQRQAEQWCTHSRRAAFDRSQSRSECLRAWTDLRDARDKYLDKLGQGCRAAQAEAAACEAAASQAEAQSCLESMAAKAAQAEAEARAVLDDAMARVNEIHEQFHKRYSDLGDDRRFLEGRDPNDPDLAALVPRARDYGARTLRDYGKQAELVGHEQQLVANAAFLFKEAAGVESANRLAAQRTLTSASETANQRAEALGDARKESTITGRTDSSSLPAVPPMAPAQGAQGGQGSTAESKHASGRKSAAAAAVPGLPQDSSSSRSLASVSRSSSPSTTGTRPDSPSPSKTGRPAAEDSGRPAPSATAIAGRGGSGTGAADLREGTPAAGRPASGAASNTHGPGRAVTSRSQKKAGEPSSGDGEGAGAPTPAGAGTSLLDAPLGLLGASGQLGPSEMMMKEEGELSPEELLGLGDLKGDAPLTAEEMALLGLDPGGSPAEGKAARATLSAQLRALSHSGALQSGIGSVDSVGIFLRVRHLHVRAQKKGLVMHLRKKL